MAEFNETLEVAVNDGLSVSFYKGLRANLPVVGVDGVYYQCTDTGELFLGTGTGMKQVTKEIDLTNYATKDDLQNVPHAQTASDLTGRVEATPEVFTYRPSAGNKSIKDDNAFIRRIKGNSVVFNQLVKNALDQSGNNGWWSRQGANNVELNGSSIKLSFVSGTNSTPQISQKIPLNANHTYFLTVNIDFNISNDAVCYLRESSDLYGDSIKTIIWAPSEGHYNAIFTPTDGYSYLMFSVYRAINDVGDSVTVSDMQIIDLTAMFGAGNEPTAEEFRALYPNSYYPYNAGELRNLSCFGIRTVGFNQWDGKVEVGYIRDGTGDVNGNQNYLCTDFIRVIANQEYYINTEQTDGRWGAWYDANKNYVAGIIGYDQVQTAPANAAYVRLTIKTADSGNPDTFCINLHHTGYRDGEYERYKEVVHTLPLRQITGGQPLRKAGSVYDEINETEYIRRVGIVDLGSLNWWLSDSNKSLFAVDFFHIWQDNHKAANILCVKYATLDYSSVYMESTGIAINFYAGNYYLTICDKSFTDVASFKASLSGVLLHYELAEPIVNPIDTPIDFNYYVEDFGTEEALLTENSAPFSADIIYQFNAVDRIRQNDLNIDRLEDKIYNLDQSIKGKAEKAEYFPISLESLYAVAEGETVSADKYTIIQMLYRQQTGINDLLLQNDEGLTVGYVVGGVVGDSLQFSAYTNDGKLIKVVASESEDELTESDVEVFDLLSSGEPNSQLAYAEYTGTATAAVVTTKYGYFPTTLVEGATVAVKFEGSLTYITTLNVNGTGAKNVYYKGNSLTSGSISRYNTYLFVYDGSYYRIVGIDTDTHYTAKNVVTSSSTSKSNAAATNGNVRLNLIENSTVRSTHKIVGTGATAVTSDSSGNITIDTPIKTINGESIVGSGDITIEGGGGDDIRYFTEFTVGEFVAACKNENSITSEGLFDAIMSNKIICIPYSNEYEGFTIASSSYVYQDATGFHEFFCEIESGIHKYIATTSASNLTDLNDTLSGLFPVAETRQVVILDSPIIEYQDNITYFIREEVDELLILYLGYKGSSISFTTGDNPTLVFYTPVVWANGVMPEIEPNTYYELSLLATNDDYVAAVLTPFKPVE